MAHIPHNITRIEGRDTNQALSERRPSQVAREAAENALPQAESEDSVGFSLEQLPYDIAIELPRSLLYTSDNAKIAFSDFNNWSRVNSNCRGFLKPQHDVLKELLKKTNDINEKDLISMLKNGDMQNSGDSEAGMHIVPLLSKSLREKTIGKILKEMQEDPSSEETRRILPNFARIIPHLDLSEIDTLVTSAIQSRSGSALGAISRYHRFINNLHQRNNIFRTALDCDISSALFYGLGSMANSVDKSLREELLSRIPNEESHTQGVMIRKLAPNFANKAMVDIAFGLPQHEKASALQGLAFGKHLLDQDDKIRVESAVVSVHSQQDGTTYPRDTLSAMILSLPEKNEENSHLILEGFKEDGVTPKHDMRETLIDRFDLLNHLQIEGTIRDSINDSSQHYGARSITRMGPVFHHIKPDLQDEVLGFVVGKFDSNASTNPHLKNDREIGVAIGGLWRGLRHIDPNDITRKRQTKWAKKFVSATNQLGAGGVETWVSSGLQEALRGLDSGANLLLPEEQSSSLSNISKLRNARERALALSSFSVGLTPKVRYPEENSNLTLS
jgi:hypothetical protein